MVNRTTRTRMFEQDVATANTLLTDTRDAPIARLDAIALTRSLTATWPAAGNLDRTARPKRGSRFACACGMAGSDTADQHEAERIQDPRHLVSLFIALIGGEPNISKTSKPALSPRAPLMPCVRNPRMIAAPMTGRRPRLGRPRPRNSKPLDADQSKLYPASGPTPYRTNAKRK